MKLYKGEHVITDDNYQDHLEGGVHAVATGVKVFGGKPRPKKFAAGFYDGSITSITIPEIPQAEWSGIIKKQEANKSRLSDIILGYNIPSLDQNGKGYCWAHSTTGALIALRAAMNLPYVPLSAYSVACKIKNFADQGGWGALSMDFAMSTGIAPESVWPAQSMSRSNDNPTTWAEAAKYKVADGWMDLGAAQYDRNLTFNQIATLLLCRIPVVGDFNWWGHSIYLADLVEPSPGQFGVRFRNSWGDTYGSKGFSVLTGSKVRPDGAVAPSRPLMLAA